VRSQQTSEKATHILKAVIAILSKVGYEKTTINEISAEANISRGLMHYYFKDKEDMVAQALTYGFGSMWDSSISALSQAKTAEELADSMIDVLKKNIKNNPDFTALLFEMWVSSRRSRKIEKVFREGLEEAINRMIKMFELARMAGILNISPDEPEGIVRLILAMYHGLAIQLLTNPDKINDKKIWIPVKKSLLFSFGQHQ
jgi:AcrR family transcriptional regulator